MTSPVDYVARGWPIFPCHWIDRGRCSCKQDNCRNPGKHPLTQHGFKAATTDTHMINGWMAEWPNANWAIRTGPEIGLTVVDLDPRHGGYDSIKQLQQQRGPMPETLTSFTGGGGQHLFYLTSPGFVIPSVTGWMPGIDDHQACRVRR
jgi:hypothetical protein